MKELLPHLDCLSDCQSEMVDQVIELCNINSGTLHLAGIDRVAEVLRSIYSALNGDDTRVPISPLETVDDGGNLVETPLAQAIHIVKRPDIRPRVILCIHMDTVYGPEHSFQTCRWLDENTLNGPGVADAKGGLVVMLHALKTLESSPFADRIGWEVIINPDEELGSPGSTPFLHERARQADVGMLFEPSLPDGSLVSWRKGAGNFTFIVRGKSAHSGRDFHDGKNAVVALSKLLIDIDRLNTNPEVTFNAASIRGGNAPNMVPDLAIGVVNVRVRTLQQKSRAEAQLNELARQYDGREGIRIEMHGMFRSPPKTLDEGTIALQRRIEKCGQALAIPIQWQGTGGASDGNKFAAVGLANIDTFGPQGGKIHSAEEFLLTDSLVPRAKLAALVLLSLAAESPDR